MNSTPSDSRVLGNVRHYGPATAESVARAFLGPACTPGEARTIRRTLRRLRRSGRIKLAPDGTFAFVEEKKPRRAKRWERQRVKRVKREVRERGGSMLDALVALVAGARRAKR